MVTITDEIVEAAILGFIHNQPDPGDVKAALISDMRAALTAALALVTPPRDKIEALRDFRPGSSEYNRGLDDAMRALAAMPEGGDGPKRWRHVKRGLTYVEVGRGELQTASGIAEGIRMVAYRCETDGRVWFRPESEFEDGRFVAEMTP